MSPGSQMRALTANKARPNSTTIAAGNRVERKNCTGWGGRGSILAGWQTRGRPPAWWERALKIKEWDCPLAPVGPLRLRVMGCCGRE